MRVFFLFTLVVLVVVFVVGSVEGGGEGSVVGSEKLRFLERRVEEQVNVKETQDGDEDVGEEEEQGDGDDAGEGGEESSEEGAADGEHWVQTVDLPTYGRPGLPASLVAGMGKDGKTNPFGALVP